jgi:uncharacterized protein YxjI
VAGACGIAEPTKYAAPRRQAAGSNNWRSLGGLSPRLLPGASVRMAPPAPLVLRSPSGLRHNSFEGAENKNWQFVTTGYWMSRILSVANKLLSLRGAIEITDERGDLAYRAAGSFSLLSPTWRIYRGDVEVGSVRKKIFTFAPTWELHGELGAFKIKRKILSFVRRYYAVGGAADGAVVSGNFLDLRFDVSHSGQTLAKARGRLLTIRDRHEVEVIGEPELFVVFAMLVLQIDRRTRKRKAASHDD